jgi:hypothetical protein
MRWTEILWSPVTKFSLGTAELRNKLQIYGRLIFLSVMLLHKDYKIAKISG